MESSQPFWPGRNVLVTGASSGIGREVAVILSRKGARILLGGQNQERLEQTRSQLESGQDHRIAAFDLSASAEIPAWLRELGKQHGPIGGVVHSAGLHALSPLQVLKPDKVEQLMRVNVTSALMLLKGLRKCAAPDAAVVLVSSVAGMTGQAGLSAYSASKAALLGLAKSAAIELAPEGIRVNCVAPGVVETEMTGKLRDQLTDEQFAAIEAMHPLGLGTPADVANAVAFLLGPESRWVTGTALVVDGGYAAR